MPGDRTRRAPLPAPSGLPRLTIAGATGRLGSAIVAEAIRQGVPITGGIRGSPSAGRRAAPPAGWPSGVPLLGASALRDLLRSSDVFLTATTPTAERGNLPIAAELGVPAVVATTGLSEPSERWFDRVTARIPVVVDANFSLGLQLVRRLLRSLGPLPEGFDLSILEAHRHGKVDRPSGTARALAEALAGSGVVRSSLATAPRTAGTVEIASLRGGETPGVHTVWIEGVHELVRLEHIAYGRSAFSGGMITAARWLARRRAELSPGRYSLADVLEG